MATLCNDSGGRRVYNGSLAHRKVWPASRACAESNCMDISLNKVCAGGFLVRDRPDTRLVVFLHNKPNKVLRVRQTGCVHEFCQRLGLRSALRASLLYWRAIASGLVPHEDDHHLVRYSTGCVSWQNKRQLRSCLQRLRTI